MAKTYKLDKSLTFLATKLTKSAITVATIDFQKKITLEVKHLQHVDIPTMFCHYLNVLWARDTRKAAFTGENCNKSRFKTPDEGFGSIL